MDHLNPAQEADRLRAQVRALQAERKQVSQTLQGLGRLGRGSLLWDGTPSGLSDVAAHIRESFGYQQVAISLLNDGTLAHRAVYPPTAQIDPLPSSEWRRVLAAQEPKRIAEDTLLIPLVCDGESIGWIEACCADRETDHAMTLWQVLAPHITANIVGGRLIGEIERAHRREQVLHDITRELTSDLNLDKMLGDVLALTVPYIGAEDGSIMLLDDQQRVINRILSRKELSLAQERQAIQHTLDRGLAGWIIKHRAPALIKDTLTDDRWIHLPGDDETVRSVLGAPLQHGDRIRGLVFLVHRKPGCFDDDDLGFLTSVADQAAIAAENAYLMEQTQQRVEQLALINEISQAASTLHLNDVLRIVTQRIVQALQVVRCAVFLLDENKMNLVLRAVHNPNTTDDDIRMVVSLADRPHIASAMETQRPVEIPDVLADHRLCDFWDKARELDIQSQLGVPLIVKQRVIGAIGIDKGSSNPSFSESDLNLCQTIAQQAAIAIENARLYQEVQNRAERLWLANRVSHDIGTQLDIHQLLWEIVRLIRDTFDCYYVAVGLIEDQDLIFRSGIDAQFQAIPQTTLELSEEESIAGWVARQGQSILVPDVSQDPRYQMRPGLEDIRSQLTVPLKVLERTSDHSQVGEQTIGVLDMGSIHVDAFSAEDQHLLEALAMQISAAIENARLFTQAQEERATLEAIINGTDDAIIITDTEDHVLIFNPAAQEVFGQGKTLQPGSTLFEAVDDQALCDFWQRATENDLHSAEIPLPDGRTFHASMATVPEVGRVAVMQDITYLKRLDEIKSDFVSTVSHDLRSPLQVIQSSAELIPRLGQLNPEQRRQVEHIMAIVRRISDLVQNLLDIGRIEAGVGMDTEACAIDEIIARAAGSCRSLAQSKNLDFTIELPSMLPLVYGNPLRLDQVITNLVTNAIKFTPEGSVTVSAWSKDEQVVIEVQDTGLGIPLDAQENLFQKFYRVKRPETRGIQGTGLGLAIVKSIVENYGGEIELESFPRLGSTFTVRLPVYSEDAIPA